MANVTQRARVFPAMEGLVTAGIPGGTSPASLMDCDNIYLDQKYGKMKRPGITGLATGGIETIATPQCAFDFWRASGTAMVQRLVCAGGGDVFADNGAGLFHSIKGAAPYTATSTFSMAAYCGLLIVCSNDTAPYKWNQTGNLAVLGGAPPTAKFARIFRRYTMLAGAIAAPHRLYPSTLPDDPESGYTHTLDIDGGDDDPCGLTGIMPPAKDTLVLGKRNSLYALYATGDYTYPFGYNPLDCSHGLLHHNCSVAIPGDVIYASDVGIHSLQLTVQYGNTQSSFLSAPISNLWQDNIDFAYASSFSMVYDAGTNSVMLSCREKGATCNNLLLIFNLELKQWSMCKTFDANHLFKYTDPVSYERKVGLITSGRRLGYLDSDVVTDFGVTFGAHIKTPVLIPTAADILHTFLAVTLFYCPMSGSDKVNCTYWIDAEEIETVEVNMKSGAKIGSAIIGHSIIGRSGEWARVTFPIKGSGTSIQFQFSQDAGDNNFAILGYILEYEVNEDDVRELQVRGA